MTLRLVEPRPLIMAELEATEHPRPEDILNMLHEHADAAAHIQALAVTSAIERANPSERQLLDLQEAAVRGIIVHTLPTSARPHDPTDEILSIKRDQYAQVVGYVGRLLETYAY